MTDSLADLLAGKKPDEPEEFTVIRRFIQDKFNFNPRLQRQGRRIVVIMPSAAAAGNLQLDLLNLEQKLPQGTRIIIRIG